ncbi:hypothetical protein C3477_06810 [Mycobacterium kansasii]|uniref:hypothetical protein n=1 Tax=Mycobacterium kansasii TaxID=1768 RepID=UPI000CDCF36C|nr:hypothetical protein [Mycobacterium kansasii]POX90644.1 hypothetical protein C3B43_06540 [Mycobacterium kansasii]POY07670.1 hypothetical protein C3477_06810 [Mycobacterium kansasii]POY22654.1 hypothetical protein C3476_10410 [Mycobacterium kansasii]
MTDARLPERWLNDRRLQRLSPEHFRAYVNALLYAVANRTDGHIDRADLGLIPHWCAGAARAFVDARLFTPCADGWLIADYSVTQSSRDDLETLERIRAADRRKKARKRAGEQSTDQQGDETDDETPQVPGDVPGDVPGTFPGDSTGRKAGRQAGKDKRGDQQANEQAGEQPVVDLNGEPDGSDAAADWPPWRGAGLSPFEEYR